MSSEKVEVNVSGLQYSFSVNRYESEIQKYNIAWDVANTKPATHNDFNQKYCLARAKQSQKILGCDYDKQTQQKILETFACKD
jgi:hypothetical protein